MLFVLGGYDDTPRLYNLTTRSWTTLATTLDHRRHHACGYVDTGAGGVTGVIVAGGGRSSGTSEFYDLETGAWSRAGDLNVDRYAAPEIVRLAGRYFIIGGGPASVEEFLPANKTWSTAGLPGL